MLLLITVKRQLSTNSLARDDQRESISVGKDLSSQSVRPVSSVKLDQ